MTTTTTSRHWSGHDGDEVVLMPGIWRDSEDLAPGVVLVEQSLTLRKAPDFYEMTGRDRPKGCCRPNPGGH